MVLLVAFVALSLLKLSSAVVCHFDASCTCTRDHPNLGEAECSNTRVSLSRINASKLYSLALINNQIDYLPSNLFEGTGLYRFHLSHNAVYQLEEDMFSGVEYALWELHLTYCKLSAIPFKSIRHLQKLRTLNLTGNAILAISADQLRGVAASLQVLILAENRLASLPDGVFSGLQSLETLNLRGNALTTLEPAAFTPPPLRLSILDLSDNLLKSLNYRQLSNIRSLTTLDVSLNSISYLPNRNESFRLMLDSLYLDYNNITELETMSFVNFAVVNKTSLKGNPLNSLQPNAFQPCRIEELYLSDCQLTSILSEAFEGLDETLKVLDLSGNNISTFKFALLQKFESLTSLRVDHNLLAEYNWLQPPGQKQPSSYQLLELSILGKRNAPVTMQKFPRLPHLHTLSISQTSSPILDPEQLNNFSVELETLKIEEGSLKSLNAGIFKHVRGIKTLDLTDNNIESVDALTFVEVSHSIERLILVHSFTAKVGALPAGLLRPLSSLSLLKLNHNTLRKLPIDIRWISSLEILHAHDNIIDFLPNTLFESNAHKKLREVILTFNKISKVQMGTFSDLASLSKIDLSDNEIASVEKGAFRNLEAVKRISLRGNRLSTLADEAFQNVRNLELLDVSYNSLLLLSMSSFDQVGTYSSTMVVNASHNKISSLTSPRGNDARQFSYSSAIKVLDFSHNNISIVQKEYFTPIQDCLAQLIFSNNSIRNVSRDMLPNLPQLQYLDLSFNGYLDIEFDALRGLPYLQTFLINGNGVRDLPGGLFPSLNRLETLDFSNNGLTGLSDSFITAMSPILLDASHNSLTRVPLTSFSQSHAGNVQQLILRSNKISRLPSAESFARFSGLRYLDLTDNRLTDLGSSLSGLPCLTKLSVSYNRIRFDPNDWRGQERSLRHLDLSNTSLSYVPALPLPSLLTLKLSNNGIAYIPQDLQTNLTNLKMLDVSYNIIPELTPFSQLVYLNAASNPITSISNSTFTSFLNLADLDIRLLPLTTFDEDALDQLPLLTLAVSNYKQVERINIPFLMRENQALRHLIYEVAGTPSIGNEMQGMLPEKIRQITLQGRDLKSIPHYLLQSVGRPAVLLTLQNTSVEALDSQLFRSPRLRNISLELMSGSLKTVGNPSNVARPNVPHSVFLIDMRLQSEELVCDCKLGWIETWARKKRQRTGSYLHSEDLRSSTCKNKQGKPFVDILKSELECGWSGGIKCSSVMALIASSFIVSNYVL